MDNEDEDLRWFYETHLPPAVEIGMQMRSLMESISELTKLASEHRELMRPDLFDLQVSANRLALIISAIDAMPYIQAAE